MGQPQDDITAPTESSTLDRVVGALEAVSTEHGFMTLPESIPSNWVYDIAEMHTKFGVNRVIDILPADKLETFLKFRLDFLREELIEAYNAAGYSVSFGVIREGELDPAHAEDVVDAMIDLCVVSIGTLDAFGVNSHTAWNRVHDKNMQKEPGIKPERINPLGLPDLIKPENWQPPSHADNVGLLAKVFASKD